MARYDYQCTACEAEEEIEHPMSHKPKVLCKACNGTMEIVIRPNPVHFKGLGWESNSGKDLFNPPAGLAPKIR